MGLDTVELLLDVEKHFAVRISDQQAESIETVGDFVDCVHARLTEQRREVHKDFIFAEIKTILREGYIGNRMSVTLESRIVQDLRLD